jgi:hypothetical protein
VRTDLLCRRKDDLLFSERLVPEMPSTAEKSVGMFTGADITVDECAIF